MYNAQLETFIRVADAGSFSKAAELQYMVHLGLHMNMVMGAIKKAAGLAKPSKAPATALRVMAAMLCGYGIYAFIGRQIGTYMLLTNQYVFFDFSEPLIFFLLDYAAMMGLFVCIGHYGSAMLRRVSTRKSAKTKDWEQHL